MNLFPDGWTNADKYAVLHGMLIGLIVFGVIATAAIVTTAILAHRDKKRLGM